MSAHRPGNPLPLRSFARSRRLRPLVDTVRTAFPYIPVRQRLPDGDTIWRHFGDRHAWRIVEEVYLSRVYEELPALRPREGDVVLDLGAHIGVYSVRAAGLVGPRGRVVAVEPDPRNFALLQRNARNAEGRIDPIRIALWDRPGELVLHRDPSQFGSHSVVLHRSGDARTVRAQTLDGLVRERRVEAPTLVKMDLEGAAPQVTAGGLETFRRWMPRIVCAAYHTPDEADRIASLLQPIGYDVELKGVRLSFAPSPETYLYATPAGSKPGARPRV